MLPARSIEEALLYLDLHFCSCDRPRLDLDQATDNRQGVLVAVYEGRCERCGTTGHFEFALDDTHEFPYPAIGGERPSRIIDPGEFLWLSDNAASRVPVDLSGLSPDELSLFRILIENALTTLEEVRKFVPDGATEVPGAAFVSELGRSVREESPGRFRLAEIQERLRSYHQALARLTPAPSR